MERLGSGLFLLCFGIAFLFMLGWFIVENPGVLLIIPIGIFLFWLGDFSKEEDQRRTDERARWRDENHY
jgi:hypothetical protein